MRVEAMLTFPVWHGREFKLSDKLCFVLMPFHGDDLQSAYAEIIAPAILGAGLRPLRADECHGQDIMQDIWTNINESRLVIADLTGRNPNVLYEVGMTHVLGKPLLLLTADRGSDIPFDLKHFRHILYDFSEGGLEGLRAALNSHLTALMKEHPTGSQLIKEVEAATQFWVARFHDPLSLGSTDLLRQVRQFVIPEHLSDVALEASPILWTVFRLS